MSIAFLVTALVIVVTPGTGALYTIAAWVPGSPSSHGEFGG